MEQICNRAAKQLKTVLTTCVLIEIAKSIYNPRSRTVPTGMFHSIEFWSKPTESDVAGKPTNTIALQFPQYSTATDLTASTEQRYRRTQSYDPVAEPWHPARRICISVCHQHTNVDTSYVIQLTAIGTPFREKTRLGLVPSPVGPRTSQQQVESLSSRSERADCGRQGMKQTNRKLSLRNRMMSVGDVRALSGRLYQKPPTSPAT